MKKKTDFTKILEELRANGFNDYRMAELTGIGRTSLSKLRTGTRKQPKYDDGASIMEVHEKECST